MSTMIYKGYAARIEYSDEDGCFIGHIAGIKDVTGFHADSVKELKQAFFEAVDDYLATCEKLGKAPQKPYADMAKPLSELIKKVDPAVVAVARAKADQEVFEAAPANGHIRKKKL